MAPSSNGPLKVALTVAFILSLTFLPPKSVWSTPEPVSGGSDEQSEMVLGSKPPDCVNKCLNCKPCVATLVIPSQFHKRMSFTAASRGEGDDDSYYLLSWKCKCGDKLFQP
ncbi:hypothetical protein SLEP1_g44058 [Rubroshorea leprosula]|uniref:Epidermal patterning factor-like protein n=1 Tax=Rubroshorea leprosula TaxID=152421 RepID=A0AAV5LF23_9ROSI|nr:hypothetical protein SLEP1_g44058 [Rubroshorea leprosula]